MQVTMRNAQSLTLEQMRGFVAASDGLGFAGTSRAEIYGFVEGVLRRQRYRQLSKKDKGVVRRYLARSADGACRRSHV